MDIKEIWHKLIDELGDSPKIIIKDNFENWGRTQKPGKLLFTQPKSVEEVQKVIIVARKMKLKVRAVGSTHSWSPLYPDEGNIMIDGTALKCLNGRDITYNEDKGTVTMASGVNMHELMEFFINHNLCFESNVILRDVTIAGIVSTGCHGVGGDQLCVSDWITEIALVDSKGRLREFKQGVNTADEMKAVQVSLGMFGILVSITMKVQTQFLVRTDNLFPRVLDYFFNPGALKEFVNSNWSVEMFWFPFSGMELVHLDQFEAIITGRVGDYSWNPMNDNLWVRAINRYKKTDLHLPPITKEYHMKDDSANDLADGSLQMVEKLLHPLNKTTAGRVIDKLIHKHIDPIFMYASFKGIQAQYGPVVGVCQPITNAIHYRTFKNMVPVYDMSFAFHCPNTEKGFHTICQAITKVIEMVQHSAIEGRYPLLFEQL